MLSYLHALTDAFVSTVILPSLLKVIVIVMMIVMIIVIMIVMMKVIVMMTVIVVVMMIVMIILPIAYGRDNGATSLSPSSPLYPPSLLPLYTSIPSSPATGCICYPDTPYNHSIHPCST